MSPRYLLALVLTLLLGSALSCGGNTSSPAPNNTAPAASGGDSPSRSASSTFTYFFYDGVTNTSAPMWNVNNGGGGKFWQLSNTCYSSPKAWVVGGNYFNNEYDTLTTDPFTVPANTNGVRLAFYSRWSIAGGDFGYVQYSINGGAYQVLNTYTNGANIGYPSWYKYSYAMPNTGASAQTWRIRYTFTSNGSGTNWGYGIDSVSVYQTNLNAPINVLATDDQDDQITISWSHNNAGNLAPDLYDVYHATSENGTYLEVGSVAYPDTEFVETIGASFSLWYKVKAVKNGWPDSPFSNADQGTSL